MAKIRPITLEIEEEVWNKFKEQVPRTIKLSRAIEDLIIDYLKIGKKRTER